MSTGSTDCVMDTLEGPAGGGGASIAGVGGNRSARKFLSTPSKSREELGWSWKDSEKEEIVSQFYSDANYATKMNQYFKGCPFPNGFFFLDKNLSAYPSKHFTISEQNKAIDSPTYTT